MLTNDRLWVGTGNGVILSVPLVAARPARDDGDTPTSSPGTGGSGGPGGAVRVYSNEGKDGDAPRGSSFMPYCSMVSKTQPGITGIFFLWRQCGRVVRAPDLSSKGRGFKCRSLAKLELFLSRP